MKLSRERVAHWLDRSRAADFILWARSRTRIPILPVLCYHSVGDPGPSYRFDPEVIDVTPEQFRRQLEILAKDCTVIGMDTLCAALHGEKLPPNAVLISFDDGYRSCLDTALPILRDFGFSATFFIATHYVGKRRLYWWDKIHYILKTSALDRITIDYPKPIALELADPNAAARELLSLVKSEKGMDLDNFFDGLTRAAQVEWSDELETSLADELIMHWDDVRQLHAAGMDIESHTRTHRVLQTLEPSQLADELTGSRDDIRDEIGQSARTVAYPVGYTIRSLPVIRQAVANAGYEIGFTNASGVNYMWTQIDRFDVRRIAMGRELTPTLFRGQLAVPQLAYASNI